MIESCPVDRILSSASTGQSFIRRGKLADVTTLADRIEWILASRGTSARALSLAAGLSQSHVGQLKRGQLSSQVAAGTLAAIARAAHVDPHWLQTGEGSPEVTTSPVNSLDVTPNRTEAARIAREDGVYEPAVLSVLAEEVGPATAGRSTLWWALRMRGRELDLLGSRPVPRAEEQHAQEHPPPPTQRKRRG